MVDLGKSLGGGGYIVLIGTKNHYWNTASIDILNNTFCFNFLCKSVIQLGEDLFIPFHWDVKKAFTALWSHQQADPEPSRFSVGRPS